MGGQCGKHRSPDISHRTERTSSLATLVRSDVAHVELDLETTCNQRARTTVPCRHDASRSLVDQLLDPTAKVDGQAYPQTIYDETEHDYYCNDGNLDHRPAYQRRFRGAWRISSVRASSPAEVAGVPLADKGQPRHVDRKSQRLRGASIVYRHSQSAVSRSRA
jgi:hypothetical protein